MRGILEDKLRKLSRIDASRLSEYQHGIQITAATKIQALWRGYRARKITFIKHVPRVVSDHQLDALETVEDEDPEDNLARMIEKITTRSLNHNENLSRLQLLDKIAEFSKLCQAQSRYIPIDNLNSNMASRTKFWLQKYENYVYPSQEPLKSKQDPDATPEIMAKHEQSLKIGRLGWWKENLKPIGDWKKADPAFESWMQEIVLTTPDCPDRYY